MGRIELVETPDYCNHGYTRRFTFTYHDRNHIIENCDYGGYESIAQDDATFMNNRPEAILGHLDAISVKFCPNDNTESSVNPASELIQILETIRAHWVNHNANAHDNLSLVYWTLIPTLHSQWHDPNNDSFPSVYHQPVNEHIKQNLADPHQGIVAIDVWSRLAGGSQYPGFMNPVYAVSSNDNHLNDAGNDVLMRAFLILLDEWFGQPSFPREDINQDNLIDILDLQLIINVSIRVPTDPALRSRADINLDGVVNETDIEAFLQALFQYR